MNLKEELIKELYKEIANGDKDALEFIEIWSRYAHKFDDLVDEKFDVGLLIDCNNDFARLLTSEFFIRHQKFLIGQIYLAAESYLQSEILKVSSKYEERLFGHRCDSGLFGR